MLLAAAALALAGCATPLRHEPSLTCRADEQPLAHDVLYFGSAMPRGRVVDADAWRRFEGDTLAPAFPQGYSVVAANGVWRGADGRVTTEASRIIVIVHAETDAATAALRDVIARYRDRFEQESVLQEHAVVCARF